MFLFLREKVILRNLYVIFAVLGFAVAFYYPVQQWMTSPPQTYYSDKTDLTFASDKNIIFIFADMLQGSTLGQYLTMHPSEKDNFQGFTLFSRATSPFPFTSYGAPSIMTGKLYTREQKPTATDEYADVATSSFITDAKTLGFDSTVIGLEIIQLHNSQICYQSSNPVETSRILLALSIQKIVKTTSFLGLDVNMWIAGYKKTSKNIMDRLALAPIGKSKDKILFFHSMIPHVPIVFKRQNLESMPLFLKPLELTVENYWEEMAFFLGQLTHLFDHMKRLGIYDKSLIIVTGDHGHPIGTQPSLDDHPGSTDFEVFQKGTWTYIAGMYNAAILIKPPLQSGKLKISKAAASTLGLRPLIKQYLTDEASDLLKNFEILGKNKVVVFKNNVTPDPYGYPDNHVVFEFRGNVSALAQQLKKDLWNNCNIVYKLGTKVTDVSEYVDNAWLSPENEGVWLQNRPATLCMRIPNIEKKFYTLHMDVSGLVNKQHPVQKIRVSLNDKVLGIISITTSLKKQSVDLEIPMNLLVGNGVNVFTFQPLNAISPKEIGAWDFDSPLSMFLRSFQLIPLQEKGHTAHH